MTDEQLDALERVEDNLAGAALMYAASTTELRLQCCEREECYVERSVRQKQCLGALIVAIQTWQGAMEVVGKTAEEMN